MYSLLTQSANQMPRGLPELTERKTLTGNELRLAVFDIVESNWDSISKQATIRGGGREVAGSVDCGKWIFPNKIIRNPNCREVQG